LLDLGRDLGLVFEVAGFHRHRVKLAADHPRNAGRVKLWHQGFELIERQGFGFYVEDNHRWGSPFILSEISAASSARAAATSSAGKSTRIAAQIFPPSHAQSSHATPSIRRQAS